MTKLVRLEDVEVMIKKWLEKEEGKENDVEFAKWVYSTRKQILEELLSSLQSLPTQPIMGEWIPVSDRVPLYNERVLLYMTHAVKSPKERKVIIGSYDGNFNTFYNDEGNKLHMYNVTHFVPLPNPPSN